MLSLIISACLIDAPAKCEDFYETLQGGSPVFACGFGAQVVMADWQAKHPGWQIKKWACSTRTFSKA